MRNNKGQIAGVLLHNHANATSLSGALIRAASSPASTQGNVDYHGGPVLHASTPYFIFWDPGPDTISTGTKARLQQYFSDVAADSGKSSNVFGVLRQYGDSNGIANYSQTWSTTHFVNDTNAYPSTSPDCTDNNGSFTEDACLMDSQVQSEVEHEISTQGWPIGIAGSAPIYFVVLPPDVNSCLNAPDIGFCADNYFCAYHSYVSDDGNPVTYANIPLIGAAQDPKDCQVDGHARVQAPNGAPVSDLATSYMAHEDMETVTDPLGDAWWSSITGNEVADNCVFSGPFDPADGYNPGAWLPTLGGSAGAGTLFDQIVNGDDYYTQTVWSNGNGDCEAQPAAAIYAA